MQGCDDGELWVEKSININKQKKEKIMFKYDDVISTLTLVNTLARDPDYGNIKQINYNCDIENSQNICLKIEQDCDLVVFKNSNFCENIFYLETFLRIKLLVKNLRKTFLKYFYKGVNVCENLIIILQKMVLYNLWLLLDYG